MSSVVEIESEIEKLSPEELIELSSWMEPHMRRMEEKRQALNEVGGYLTDADDDFVLAKLRAIKETSGCLGGEEGEEFEKAVAAAGSDVIDSHEW